jgi:hypothetical protein
MVEVAIDEHMRNKPVKHKHVHVLISDMGRGA